MHLQSTDGRFCATHGLARSHIYKRWNGMRNRCLPGFWKTHPTYTGVKHCEEWRTFEGFLANQPPGRPYEKGLVLSRIGDKGDYEPTNCRWITKSENTLERTLRLAVRLPDGRMAYPVAAENGIGRSAFSMRLMKGWDLLRAATEPLAANGGRYLKVAKCAAINSAYQKGNTCNGNYKSR